MRRRSRRTRSLLTLFERRFLDAIRRDHGTTSKFVRIREILRMERDGYLRIEITEKGLKELERAKHLLALERPDKEAVVTYPRPRGPACRRNH